MADRAEITPKVLKWARESAKMSEEVAAAKADVPVEKLLAWEQGESYPTINQAQKLAKAYKRPFALLFLADIPNDFQPLRDFRRKGSKPFGTGSIFIIREIQQKQSWISEVNKDENAAKSPFIGRFTFHDNPVKVANDILDTFDINPTNYLNSSPIKDWIDKSESNGICISRTSFIHSRMVLDSDEIQGFAIADPYAPFVFINSEDYDAPQLFTLVHEIAHLWIAATGISNGIEHEIKNSSDYQPIELFCNEVAGNALMPLDVINSLPSNAFDSVDKLFPFAKRLGVSTFALLVRGLKLKRISLEKYQQLKLVAESEYQAFLRREAEKKEKQKSKDNGGGPSYYLLQVNRNSRLFTQTVLDAFRGGMIEPTQASNLLNVKVNRFPKLEEQLYR